jgi:hypothetical protein
MRALLKFSRLFDVIDRLAVAQGLQILAWQVPSCQSPLLTGVACGGAAVRNCYWSLSTCSSSKVQSTIEVMIHEYVS